jgi:tRNA-Thr(GGU) m(6)t(6)A37 methyltransferase TsaA
MPESLPTYNSPVVFHPIGVVQNRFDQSASPDEIRADRSKIVIDGALADGLTGLEPGQQIMVIFYFHKAPEAYALRQHPRGDRNRPPRGVFALRIPRRPNPIGVTVVDLIGVEGNVLYVKGLDALNGTPVLDIKPA